MIDRWKRAKQLREIGESYLGIAFFLVLIAAVWYGIARALGIDPVVGFRIIAGLGGAFALLIPFGVLSGERDAKIDLQVANARDKLEKPAEVLPLVSGPAEEGEPLTRGGAEALLPADRVQPAWDVARGTLEKYWARNLDQNQFIFGASVIASILGFSVTAWASYTGIQDPSKLHSAILAAISGGITQIIGATFLVIFRSTAQQALQFNRTLERMNSVGMAWYVLETMSEANDVDRKAKNAAKAALVVSVVVAGGNASTGDDAGEGPPKPRKPAPNKSKAETP